MHTHRSQGHRSVCLVKAEVNSFEYKQCAALQETVLIRSQCMLSFPLRNTGGKTWNRPFMSSLSLALFLSIVLRTEAKVESREATNQTHCKR